MKHRIIALALAGTLSIGLLAGCGGNQDAQTSPDATSPSPEVTVTPEVTPEATPETTPDATPETTPEEEATVPPTTKPTQKPESSAKPSPEATPEATPESSAVQSVWNDISALELPGMIALDDTQLSDMYGISASDLEEYVCMIPMMAVHATEFFVAEVKDGKMDAVKEGIAKRQADLQAQWSQYLPEQLELVENYQLVTSGNYILFAISEQADAAVTAFNTYTK
mgnify:CR=1 FL=1